MSYIVPAWRLCVRPLQQNFRRGSQVVRQRSAKPLSPVRIRSAPPFLNQPKNSKNPENRDVRNTASPFLFTPFSMAKAKRKSSSVKGAAAETPQEEAPVEDPMSQCVALCQEQRWREALIIFMRMCDKAERENNQPMVEGLMAGRQKVEYSLRRQMAAGLIHGARQLLAEEYLLDVGE